MLHLVEVHLIHFVLYQPLLLLRHPTLVEVADLRRVRLRRGALVEISRVLHPIDQVRFPDPLEDDLHSGVAHGDQRSRDQAVQEEVGAAAQVPGCERVALVGPPGVDARIEARRVQRAVRTVDQGAILISGFL